MPDAKDNAKLTGDTHPPEVREAADRPPGRIGPPEATEGAAGQGAQDVGAPPGKRTDQAGIGKDKDAPGARSDRKS
jgi:hypothetical protein